MATCPSCKKLIHCRTDLRKQTVYLTSRGSTDFDDLLAVTPKQKTENLRLKQQWQDTYDSIQAKLGHYPLDSDVYWWALNAESMYQSKRGDWHGYALTFLTKGGIKLDRKKYESAIRCLAWTLTYLAICDSSSPDLVTALNWLNLAKDKLQINTTELRTLFLKYGIEAIPRTKPGYSIGPVWDTIEPYVVP